MEASDSPWAREIVELHDFFEAYFAGRLGVADTDRLEVALAPEFSIVSPGGSEATRAQTIEAISSAHATTDELTISVHDVRLLLDAPDVVLARYVERHRSPSTVTDRLSTVLFRRDPDAPNGLVWLTVHETALPS